MNTVKFEHENRNGEVVSYNSYDDLGLILSAKTIGAPAPKVLTVDVPCGDGELDYTDYFGEVNYYNRELSFDFTAAGDSRDFLNVYSRLLNLFNGRKMKVTLSDDPQYYYVGRVSVDPWQSEKNIGKVTVKVNAEPYKLKHALTVMSIAGMSGNRTINCKNSRMRTVATFTASNAFSLGSNPDSLTRFQNGVAEVVLGEGDNVMTINSESNVVITYREGSL